MCAWWGNLDININNTITTQWHITHLIITLIIIIIRLPALQMQTKQEEMELELKLHNIINIINTIYTLQEQNKHIISTRHTLQKQNKHMSWDAHVFEWQDRRHTQVNHHTRNTQVNHHPHGLAKNSTKSLLHVLLAHIALASKHKQSMQMLEQQHLFINYTNVCMHRQIWNAQNNIHRLQHQTNKVLTWCLGLAVSASVDHLEDTYIHAYRKQYAQTHTHTT